MEQEGKDDAHGEPTAATPSTPTTTTTREGGQHPADPNDLNSPSIRSRGQAPGAHIPSPTHQCKAHNRKKPDQPMQRPNCTSATAPRRPTEPDPTGGGQQEGEQHSNDSGTRNQTTPHHNALTTAAAPQTEPQAPHRAGVPRAWTARSIAPKNTDYSHTPRHKAQHHDNRDNVPGPEPQTAPLTMEATQPAIPEDHTHEAPLSVSSRTSNTALETHSQVSTPADAHNPPQEPLPSGLDIPVTHVPMDLDNDPLQDSIQRVLQAATAAQQRPAWSLYRALNQTHQRITETEESRDPGTYIRELRQGIQDARQQSLEGAVVQGRVSKTGAWTYLVGSPHTQEALTFIQESAAPLPATHKETAAALVLTLHSWTRGHTIVLHDKTGPPYARTATCRPTTASAGEAHVEWTPE